MKSSQMYWKVKEMDKKQIILTLGLVIFMSMTVQPLIWSHPNEDVTTKIDCYDRFSNKIEGLTCEETIYGIQLPIKIFTSAFAVISPLIMGLAFFREDMI